MRIALWDIAAAQRKRLEALLPNDEFVDVPAEPSRPVHVDVVIASRFAAKDTDRASFRLLQLPGAGTDKIDFSALPGEPWVCNAFEHETPIADYVFAAILDHALRFRELTEEIGRRGWAGAYFGRVAHGEVGGSTLGLVGFGHISQAIARRAKAFDMRVVAVAATRRDPSSVPDVDWIGTAERLPDLLAQSDFVVLACPLNDSTRGMISARELGRMKPTALLVNIARAEIVVEADLFEALSQGTIGGAVLDTWYRYPASPGDEVSPAMLPFETLPNVRMTPHSAAWTDGVWERRCAVFADNIRRLESGRPLLNVVQAGESARPKAQSA
jgi:phosphoglycerate dehydrogenase-like enzyme